MFEKLKLKSNVKRVHEFFKQHEVDVPFFIAGGSVFSCLMGHSNYNDIDVYLYNTDDADKVVDVLSTVAHTVTKNAITCTFANECAIQVITLQCGTPQKMFDTFDLNCSKCAMTSEYEIIKDDSFSEKIELDYKKVCGTSLYRMCKYIHQKDAKDPELKEFKKLIVFFLSTKMKNSM